MFKRLSFISISLASLVFLMGISYVLGWNAFLQSQASPTETSSITINPDRLMVKVNEWRLSNNYQTYMTDNRVCNLAKIRAYELNKDFSHDGFTSHGEDFKHNGLSENISEGYLSEDQVLQGWLQSPTHKAALDKSYAYSCIACMNNYCAQIFANF